MHLVCGLICIWTTEILAQISSIKSTMPNNDAVLIGEFGQVL
jgi:hypothetical protein